VTLFLAREVGVQGGAAWRVCAMPGQGEVRTREVLEDDVLEEHREEE